METGLVEKGQGGVEMNMERIRQLVKIAATLTYPDGRSDEANYRRGELKNAKDIIKRRSFQGNGKEEK